MKKLRFIFRKIPPNLKLNGKNSSHQIKSIRCSENYNKTVKDVNIVQWTMRQWSFYSTRIYFSLKNRKILILLSLQRRNKNLTSGGVCYLSPTSYFVSIKSLIICPYWMQLHPYPFQNTLDLSTHWLHYVIFEKLDSLEIKRDYFSIENSWESRCVFIFIALDHF